MYVLCYYKFCVKYIIDNIVLLMMIFFILTSFAYMGSVISLFPVYVLSSQIIPHYVVSLWPN